MNVKTKKALRSLGLALAFSSCATAAFAGILKKPYMIYEGDNATMTVLWQDNAVETTNKITWGTDPTFTTNLGSQYVAEYGPSNQHKFKITALAPSTKYYYQVADDTNGVYGSGSFTTAPDTSANSVKFLAFGDTRSTPTAMDGVMQEMRKVYQADPVFQTFALQAGDWVSSDAESSWTAQWFNSNASTLAFLSEIPINGVKGNHEDSSGYSKYFPKYYPFPYTGTTLKSGTTDTYNNFYWSFDFGPVHFTFVDQYSPYTPGSVQYAWLVNDLKTTTKQWKVLIFHEPNWGAGTHVNSVGAQNYLDPLIRQYGVDVVYSGHNHNYSRAQVNTQADAGQNTQMPGVMDSIVPGVPYIVNGGGGAGLYAVDTTNTGVCTAPGSTYCFRHVVKAITEYEYMTFDVNDKTLTMNAFTATKSDGTRLGSTATTPPSGTKSTLIETVVLTHPTDISSEFSVTTTGVLYSRLSKQYSSTVTITNTSPSTISIPLAALLNNLTPGVTLANASGSSNGAPHVAAAVQDIAPGQSISIPLQFNNPSNLKITFTPAVIRQF
jgi:hypothetical protein